MFQRLQSAYLSNYNILILLLQDSSTTSSPIFQVKNSFDKNKLEVSLSCEWYL